MFDKRTSLICLLLAVITFGIYWRATTFNFVEYDDPEYIRMNPQVQAGLTWPGVKWAFTTDYASNWHPLTWISHMIDCQLFGLKPAGHHLTNILLHTLNVVLMFLVLLRMTGATWRSAVVAALFAWHPAHVESVAWVAERKDVLSTFFGLLTLFAYVVYVEKSKIKNRKSKIFYALSLFCFAFSLLSKPMLVTFPFLMLLLDYWPLRRMQLGGVETASENSPDLPVSQKKISALLVEKIPLLAMSFAVCLLTVHAQGKAGSVMSLQKLSFAARLEHAMVSYAKYVNMMIWPHDLCPFYPFSGAPPLGHAVVAFVILCAISLAALQWLKAAPYFPVGWFWFLGTLVPVIGVMQVGSQYMADRYTYFPYTGLFIAVVWGAAQVWESRKLPRIILNAGTVGVLVACVVVTTNQLSYWRNTTALFEHAAKVTKNNFMAYTILGGEYALAGKYDEAIQLLQASIKLVPNHPATHLYLGESYLDTGKIPEAIESLSTAVQLRPGAAVAHRKLGVALLRAGRVDDAFGQFTAATQLEPNDAKSHCQLGLICSQRKDISGAIAHYQATLAVQPNNTEALNNLAWIYAANENAAFRNGALAVELAGRACALTQNREPMLLGTLAAAYAEAGQFDNAVNTAIQARDLAYSNNQKEVAQRNEQLLVFYRSNRAYHENAAEASKTP